MKVFVSGVSARRYVPVIQALLSKAEAIYQEEVEQTLRRLSPLTPRQERLVVAMGRTIAHKLLHEPTVYLREILPDEDSSTYIELIRDLYRIQ